MAIMVLVAILFWGSLLIWAYSVNNKPQWWEDNTKYPKRYFINRLYVKLALFKFQLKCNQLSKVKNFPKISNCTSSERVYEIASQNYLMVSECPVINITGLLVKIAHRQCTNRIVVYISKVAYTDNEDDQYHVELEINPNDSALVDYLSKVFPGTEVTVTGKFYDTMFEAQFHSVKADKR